MKVQRLFRVLALALWAVAACMIFPAVSAHAYGLTQCAADRFGNNLGCTANDVQITNLAVASGSVSSCIAGTFLPFDLDATVTFGSPNRWDVGIFISNDGKNPWTRSASGGASSCSVSILPPASPFQNLDPGPWGGVTDTCGDGGGNLTGVLRVSNVMVRCEAILGSSGKLYIPYVVSWDNQSSPSGGTCTSAADPVPNTSSKCNAPTVIQATVDVVVLPTITKTDGRATISPGDSTTYQIVITNNTGDALSNAVFTDPAVADLTVNSVTCSAAGGATCPASPTIAAMQGAGIAIPTMQNNGSVTFSVNATVTGNPIGSITNTARVTVLGQTNSASDTDTVIYLPTVAKSFGTTSIAGGGNTNMTVTIGNASGSAITLTNAFTDTFPSGMTIGTGGNTGTCAGVTALAGASSFTIANGTSIPAGGCTVVVNVTSSTAGSATNAIPAGALQTSIGSNAAPASATLDVYVPPTVTKAFIPSTIAPGGTSSMVITVTNPSDNPGNLTGVSISDTYSGTLVNNAAGSVVCSGTGSATLTGGVNGGTTVGFIDGTIMPGGTCTITQSVTATSDSDNATGTPSATGPVAVTGTPAGPVTLTVLAPPTITKSFAAASIVSGDNTDMTVTIGNANSSAITLVSEFTDTFPSGMTIGTGGNTGTCAGVTALAGASSFSIANGTSIPAGGCTVVVNVTSSTAGAATNTIAAGTLQTSRGSNDSPASATLDVYVPPTVTKAFIPSTIAPGGTSSMVITVTNPSDNPGNLTGVSISDTYSGTLVNNAAGSVVCSGTGSATLTGGVNGGTTVGFIDGTIMPGGTCTITQSVTATSDSDNATGTPSATGPVAVTGTAAGPVTLTVLAQPTITKSFASPSIASGGNTDMTVTIGNSNSSEITLTSDFTDTFPSGMTIGTGGNTGTCTGVTATAGEGSFTIASGTSIPAGGCTIIVNVTSSTPGAATNTIPADEIQTSAGSNSSSASATLEVYVTPTVSKEFSPAVIPPNGTSTLTIFLGNDNDVEITLTSDFTDTLPTTPGPIVVALVPNVVTTCLPGTVTAIPGSGTVTLAATSQIPAGGCTISVDVTGSTPGVHTNIIPAGALQTDIGSNQQPANAGLLTVSTLGYITGHVFKDNNVTPNGTFEEGTDDPISSVSIELRSGTDCSGALMNTATTDVVGKYTFTNLAAGTYSVCQPGQPAGTINGITTAGTITSINGSTGTPGTASNPTATTSQIVGIVLNGDGAAGEVSGSTDNFFAEVVPSSISGSAFIDYDNNGIHNGMDTGIAGVTIELLDNGGDVVATTTTDGNGDYTFADLNPGTYSVHEPTQPPDTANGITSAGSVANGGTAGTPTAPTTVPSMISAIVLPPNTIAADNNFAEIPLGRSISGTVFLDYNNDGVLNGSDHGIESQTLNLVGTDINGNTVSRSETTNSSGAYDFLNLPEGTYTVTQPNQPAGTINGITTPGSTGGTATGVGVTPSAISSINLTGDANTISTNNNFAEQPGGAATDLALAKTHTPASFGSPSATGYFTITPSNVGSVATTETITVTDTLPAGLRPTAASGTEWSCSILNQTVTCTTAAVIEAGASGNDIIINVTVDSGLSGLTFANTAVISGGGEPPGFEGNNIATDSVAIAATASLQGTVWLDPNHNRTLDAGEQRLANWIVELLLNDVTVSSALTATDGTYSFTNISPGSGYRVRFLESANGTIFAYPVPNESGTAFTNGVVSPFNPAGADITDGTLNGLILVAGTNYVEQSLPVDPSGVVYDANSRAPISGATVSITGPGGFNPATDLVGGIANATQVTGATGYYQFLLLPSAPAGVYTIGVTPPAGYMPAPSTIIPPTAGPYVVPGGAPIAIQAQATPPTGAQPTTYYLTFLMSGASAAVVNNHIPLDQVSEGDLIITKTVNKRTVSIGDLILYTLKIQNTTATALADITIRDNIPPGFKYVEGSARIDGQPITPVGNRPIEFQGLTFGATQTRIITYVLVVGSGVQEGEYENTAFALRAGNRISNIARASVCVVKDPIFDLTTIIGKVFHDKNGNGVQDEGEEGIALAKVVSVRGEIITTDQFGRYHIAAVDAGRPDRGRNYILKVDPKSLPAGATFTTDNPRVIRITPGLMQKMNFGVKFPADATKPGEAVGPIKKGETPPAGTQAAPSPGGKAAPDSGGNTEPLSGGKTALEGKTPSISVTQDRLLAAPKLNLSIANDIIIRTATGLKDDIIFFIYTNYPDFIEGYKIIVYERADLEGKYPLKTIELKKANNYEPIYWDGILENGALLETNKEYKYILEAYGKKKRRDVTLPKFFTVTDGPLITDKNKGKKNAETAKEFPGFGIDNTAQRGIIPEGEKVVIYGKDLSPTDKVSVDEQPVTVDEEGRFIAESYTSPGEHQSTIVIKDAQGKVKSSQVERIAVAGEKKESIKAFFKDFFQDFFIVGIIDLTLGQYSFKGNVEPVAQDDHYDEKVYVDGRAAFYLKGKIKGKYLLTAYLDSEEGKLQDIYKRLGDKDPKRVFRNLDPDKYYPVYGDDSTLVSDVETQGRFYVKIEWDKSKILWGNYNTQLTGTELARYNRSLYGGKVYYESVSQTKFGDSKGIVTGFISEAQTLQDHNEFLSTGGSLYYLKNQHVVEGSDKVSIQMRDKDSGRVINTATLIAGKDYTIDYYQGRILLNSPLPMMANSNTIISSALLNGDVVSLVVDYEYNSDCFGCNNGVENLTGGARGFWWVFDQLGIGATFVREKRDTQDYNLYGVDAKIKLFKGTYTNIEFASSQQTQIPGQFSVDGGLSFAPIKTAADRDKGNAYKIGQVVDFTEITGGDFPLYLEAYYVFREKGFSSLDKDTGHDTSEYGVNLEYDITKNGTLRLKHATFDEKDALLERTSTAQLEWRWTDRLSTIFEVRYKKLKESEGNIQVVHPEDDLVLSDQEDVIGGVRVAYDLTKGTRLYADQQVTLYRNDETPRNNKTTLGISTQIAEWLKADLEGFVGDLGYGARVGLTSTVNERLNTYTSYMLSTDRTEGRTNRVTFGSTYRMNDQMDIYSENQFKDSRVETANSEIVGIKYRPTPLWNFDFKYENAHVTKDTVDSYIEQNIIKRDVASLGVTYDHGPLKASSRFELRLDRGDEDENQYVTTNSIKYTLNKEWTFLGNLNFSLTHNRTNHIDDARFFEINTGFAYRPIKLDKLNMLFKYTYLEDLPPLSQQGSTDVAERSHVVSWDGIYDLSRYFSLAGKAAFKSSQMRLGRTSGEWVSSDTMLFAGRINYQFIKNWDASLEYRFLKVIQAKDYKHGPVVCLYRHIGDHVMIGAGYNFTDFNDDLTNLSYEAGGWFVNFIATW